MASIKQKFESEGKKLVTYIMGSDPDFETSAKALDMLAENGADIIELGMPFSDPMAEGVTIQKSANRALKADGSIDNCFKLAKNFNAKVPVILMGYYNPIFHYGAEEFITKCLDSGVSGLIIVDLPAEEEAEFLNVRDKLCTADELSLIKLVAPTTSTERLEKIAKGAEGFLYYISIKGVTGTQSADLDEVKDNIARIRSINSNVNVVVGFGIKTPAQAKEFASIDGVDGVVVGSSIVDMVGTGKLDEAGNFVSDLKSNIS